MDFTALIKELGIDKLPEEDQKVALESIFRNLQKRVSLRLAHELTDEQRKQFEEISAESDEDAVAEMKKIYPDIEKVYQEEIDSMKEDMKELQ